MSETIVKNAANGTMSAELLEQLRRVDIFSSVAEEKLDCLSGAVELNLPEGELIARQGEVAHHFCILLEGQLRVYQTQPDGQDVTLSMVEAGTALGELPLLSNIPNMANVVVSQPSHLLRLDEEEFWNLMTTCPEVRRAILGNMAIRLQKLQSSTLRQEKMASLGT